MKITRPRTCNGNYTPRDLYCTPWESCGEGAYRSLLFYGRVVITVWKSIHPRPGKKNALSCKICVQLTITDNLKLESWHWGLLIYNQIVTWTAFAILAMFLQVSCLHIYNSWKWSVFQVLTECTMCSAHILKISRKTDIQPVLRL